MRQKWSRSVAASFVAVVSRPIAMMSGQSVLQSTRTRNCLPPYDAKSAAISWNGRSGTCLLVIGSLTLEGRRS